MGDLVCLWNSCLCSPTCGHFDMWLHRLSSGGLLMLFLHLPEALQTLPALRDIRDGPVELLGQRLVRVLGPAVSLQAAELLVIFFCPGPRYFWGCRRRSEHEEEVQEEIRERRTVQCKEIPEQVLECEMPEAPEALGSSCSRKM